VTGREVQLIFIQSWIFGFIFSTSNREPSAKGTFKGTGYMYPKCAHELSSTQILHITGSTIPEFISVFLHVHTGLNKKISFVTPYL